MLVEIYCHQGSSGLGTCWPVGRGGSPRWNYTRTLRANGALVARIEFIPTLR
jgi:hypothetical protein